MIPVHARLVLLALGCGLALAAQPQATLVNETEATWVVVSEPGHQIPGVLAMTRTVRRGAEGAGDLQRSDPRKREALATVLRPRDAAIIGLDKPTGGQAQVRFHLLTAHPIPYRCWLEFRLDARAVPARASLAPLDDLFCPLVQDPFRLQVSADGGTVRLRPGLRAAGGAGAPDLAGAEAKVEAKAEAKGEIGAGAGDAVPALDEANAEERLSQACAIL